MAAKSVKDTRYFGQLFDASDRWNIINHKYKCTCESILEVLCLDRLYRKFALMIPQFIAPNLVTLFGGCTYLFGFFVLFVNTNGGQECRDSGVISYNLIYLLCWWIYELCDGSDGNHARNTGQASPLGECFDHGIDGIIAPCTMLAVSSQIGCPITTMPGLIGQLVACFGGYCVQLHARHTERFYFPPVSVVEAVTVLQICHIITYIYGCNVWNFTVFSYEFSDFVIILYTVGIPIMASQIMYRSYKYYYDSNNSIERKLDNNAHIKIEDKGLFLELFHGLFYLFSMILWCIYSNVNSKYPLKFFIINLLLYSGLFHRLIIYKITKKINNQIIHGIMVPLVIIVFFIFAQIIMRYFELLGDNSNTIDYNHILGDSYFVTFVMIWCGISWIIFAIRAMTELSFILNVNVLTVTPRLLRKNV